MKRLEVALSRAVVTVLAALLAVLGSALPAHAAGSGGGTTPTSSSTGTGTSAGTPSPAPSDPPTQGTAPAPPVTTCATLGINTTGPAVKTIQTLVGTPADGDFGPQTATALKEWQTQQGIPATGVVDEATWAVMPAATAAAACAQPISGTGFTVSCAVLSQGDTGPAVAVLEAALGQPVDGQFAAATGQALSTAQQAAGLPATATTSRKTWKALKLTGTPVCTPGSTTPALPKDYKAQQKVRKQVAQLAANLLQQPGTTTNKIARAAIAFEKK
ncbi:MAG TPA: peptidoglycan-binding domain-containing protein, partial [Mycobacteriales bacterium]|nr:peptidoglycan-binding domain-containing protein [Mycobacteriales bacterium]